MTRLDNTKEAKQGRLGGGERENATPLRQEQMSVKSNPIIPCFSKLVMRFKSYVQKYTSNFDPLVALECSSGRHETW